MFEADWSSGGAVVIALAVIRAIWSAVKAWAREPYKDAEIQELTSLVAMMKDDQDRLEEAHIRERSRWESASALSSAPPQNQHHSPGTPISDEPKA